MAYTPTWKVALVDSQSEAIELLSYALKKSFAGLNVQTTTPQQVLEQPWQYHAVVTRYRLCGAMDGLELVKKLRESHFTGPIVVISNADEIGDKAKSAGADEFIPFDRWAEMPARLTGLLIARQTIA